MSGRNSENPIDADLAYGLQLAAQLPPPLADDPVANWLGLVPDTNIILDGAALARVRQAAGLKVSELAAALRELGWNYSPQDIFGWETATTDGIPPVVIRGIAALLQVPVATLQAGPELVAKQAKFSEQIRNAPAFRGLAQRYARALGVLESLAESLLVSRALVAVNRGEAPQVTDAVSSLEYLVAAAEQSHQQ